MKTIRYLILILLISFGVSSCSHETSGISRAQTKSIKKFHKPKWKGWHKNKRKNGSLYHPAVPKSTRNRIK